MIYKNIIFEKNLQIMFLYTNKYKKPFYSSNAIELHYFYSLTKYQKINIYIIHIQEMVERVSLIRMSKEIIYISNIFYPVYFIVTKLYLITQEILVCKIVFIYIGS